MHRRQPPPPGRVVPRKKIAQLNGRIELLVLDSGAYSAWVQKRPVLLDDYIEYIKANQEHIDHYINLDVIPGEFGRVPTSDEVEKSAQEGWDNMMRMRDAGLDPVPVYHQGERIEWLWRMMDEAKCDYIGISPANDRHTPQKRIWLDMVFDFITDDDGMPLIKTHGFGVTSVPLICRYPWYTADSTTWALMGGYGKVMFPHYDGGKYVYSRKPYIIEISDQSAKRRASPTHFDNLAPSMQRQLEEYVIGAGFTVMEAKRDYQCRDLLNLTFFQRLEDELGPEPRPFLHKKTGFFHDFHLREQRSPPKKRNPQ